MFYDSASERVKRKLLKAYFTQIWIDDDGYQVTAETQRHPLVAEIEAAARISSTYENATEYVLGGADSLALAPNSTAVCSSNNVLVRSAGFEPAAFGSATQRSIP